MSVQHSQISFSPLLDYPQSFGVLHPKTCNICLEDAECPRQCLYDATINSRVVLCSDICLARYIEFRFGEKIPKFYKRPEPKTFLMHPLPSKAFRSPIFETIYRKDDE